MSALMYPRSVSYGANTATSDSQSLRHRLIERRAYERWRAKGCPSGTALQDWLEAEAELDTELEMERWSYLCRTQTPAEIIPHW
jgi:hypothetical protein